MNERDCYFHWEGQGFTGAKMLALLQVTVKQIPKTPKAKTRRKLIAKAVSIIKALCYESEISWAQMGLHEHTWMQE